MYFLDVEYEPGGPTLTLLTCVLIAKKSPTRRRAYSYSTRVRPFRRSR